MSHISATIITYNEQNNIERCLCSLQGVADEIIVVDSFSTDATVDVCRRYGCHVVQRKFTGYGAQRQYATSLATHKYVLAIDADEALDETLRSNLLQLKTQGFEHRVYGINIENRYFGKVVRHGHPGATWATRLFNKRYARWDEAHRVAERLSFSSELEPFTLPGSLQHSRCYSVAEFTEKERRHALLTARSLTVAGVKIGPLTPALQAVKTYLSDMIGASGYLDGRAGHIIAKGRAKGTFLAYDTARKS